MGTAKGDFVDLTRRIGMNTGGGPWGGGGGWGLGLVGAGVFDRKVEKRVWCIWSAGVRVTLGVSKNLFLP